MCALPTRKCHNTGKGEKGNGYDVIGWRVDAARLVSIGVFGKAVTSFSAALVQ